MTFAKLLDETARRVADKTALVDGDQTWTYAAFDAMTWRAAGGLVAAGVRHGDRVALHMLNRIELAVLYFACARVGAIAVPVNTRLKPAEIDFVLRHSGAGVYVGSSDLMPASLVRSERPAHLRHVFALGAAVGACPYARLLAERPATSLPDIAASEPALIIYTSGSTSRPKGVVCSHQAAIAGAHLGTAGRYGRRRDRAGRLDDARRRFIKSDCGCSCRRHVCAAAELRR
jgi:acyl-CoA synthetase (AMP-forming)/AMP-acid ligase II